MKELDLGKKKISKLIKSFAIPCVISMIVAALYNIVDQIFIGWSDAGSFGNAATNIVYPFTVIALAFSLLIGDGAASLFSLSLGANDKKKANQSIGNGLIILIIISIILSILGLLLQDNILKLFGGNPNEIECWKYAKDYLFVICLGIPFYVIGQGLNASIRSDGSPKYAMIATLIGAISNIILDPIFIFIFNMSVKGAATATIIGQVLTFIVSLIYLTKPKTFKIEKDSIKLNKGIIINIISLGLASFITQLAIVIIISVANNLISKYGYTTIASTGEAFGVVTPLAVIGICMKVFGIVISIVIGVALGGQPIIGFNMGAGNTKRVKETAKYILITNTIVGIIAFILFEFFPTYIISIFGSNNGGEYLEYAKLCLNIYLGGIILTCIIKSTSILLQSMGSSFKSTLLALARDVIFFVPSIIIIANISGSVVTMLWSAIISDILAFITATILLKYEFKQIGKLNSQISNTSKEEYIDDKIKIRYQNKPLIITISREYGSGGRYVGKLLSEELGMQFYDKNIISLAAKESGLSEEYIKNIDQKKKNGTYQNNNDDRLFIAESKVINKIANNNSCVIVGRCADYILRNNKNVISIFLYSDDNSKVARAVKYYGLSKDKAQKEITKINKERAKHYKFYTNRDWLDFNNYDLCLNVDQLGIENTVKVIKEYIDKRIG